MVNTNITTVIIITTLIVVILCIALIYLFVYSLNQKKRLIECLNQKK